MPKRVLSVGQCGFDGPRLERLVRDFGAEVVSVSTADEALTALKQGAFDLILINRILDGDGSRGMELISRLHAIPQVKTITVMLISNYVDAQKAAVSAGAVMGFGKNDLDTGRAAEVLKPYL